MVLFQESYKIFSFVDILLIIYEKIINNYMNGNQEESNKKMADLYFKKVLNESNNSNKTEQELIDEGLWDRVKARTAGVGGAMKGLGQKASAGADMAKAGWNSLRGSTSMDDQKSQDFHKNAETNRKSAAKKNLLSQDRGGIEKQKKYVQSIAQSVITDLRKLKIPLKNEQDLEKQIKNIIWKNLEHGNEEWVGNMTDMRDNRFKSQNDKTRALRQGQR
jgi:hypothetical protein